MNPTQKKNNPLNQISQKLEEIKSDFITVASHQLRTPIAAVRWSLDILLSGKAGRLSEKQKNLIKEAYQNNKFMVKIVNDLLRTSRIEEKGVKPVIQLADLTQIVKEVIKRAKDFAKAHNCKITFQTEKNLHLAYFDPLQIKSVIESLVDNAVHYSKAKGEVKIYLGKAGDFLLFKIQDNGIGIPNDQKDLIFSKFFRARNAIKTQADGLGLNLYLAKKIIEAHGGRIEFESTENKGSTFYLYLPIAGRKENKRLEIEKLDRKEEEKDSEDILKKEREFVSVTVHELKAPLGITKWSLEALKSSRPGKLNDEQLELINQIYRGNERLLVLVRDLLDLAKLQEGKFDVKPQPIQLETIIKDVVVGFKIEAQRKNIKIELPLFKELLPKVIGDQNRIAQVITNLISNAVKYTPENGRVTIKVRKLSGRNIKELYQKLGTVMIQHPDNKNGYLVVSVADTGRGISKEEQKKLFTRFFRGRKILESKTEGTGLGLYITKTIIELHQGDIWFESTVGKGSTFYFSIPLA